MMPKLSQPMPGFLGLDRVVPRLIAEDGFENPEAALRGIAEYERFFLLAASHGKEPLVPSARVDLVWQRHMLDTQAYAEDCNRWAGAYLHREDGAPPGGFERTPGLLGTPDPAAWERPGPAFVQTYPEVPHGREGPPADLDGEDLSGVAERVRRSLRRKHHAPPWVVDARELLATDPELATGEYRRFLMLMIGEPSSLTPCKLVDEFWHQHILDSRAYFAFCSRVAGRYLHHRPSYDKPHRFHEPGFRRTQDIYRRRLESDPPARIWAHMGESGGGGGCSSTPAPPLYAIDTPDRMRAELVVGRVDRRFYRPLHPILAMRGVTIEQWAGLLTAVNSVPRPWWPNASNDLEEAARKLVLRYRPVYQGLGVTLSLVTNEGGALIGVEAALTDDELISLEQDRTRRKLPYVINRPQRVRAIISFGRVNPEHFQKLHPVLSRKGLSKRDWDEFLRAVARAPRIPWAEFAATGPTPPATSAMKACGITFLVLSCIALLSAGPANGGPRPSSFDKILGALMPSLFLGIVVYLTRWATRPFDQKGVQQCIAPYIPAFKYHGITLDFVDGIEAVRVDAVDSDDRMLPWEPGEENRHRLMEVERAKEEDRRRRRAERDSYYLDRGIKPGDWAWFRSLPDLHQAILLGFALGLPLALAAAAYFLLR